MTNKTISGNAEINSVRLKEQAGDPAQPAIGYGKLYAKTNGLYFIDDAGNVTGPLTDSVSGYTEGARVTQTSGQSIPDDTWTALQFDAEDYDTDTIHDNAINNSRLTCQTSGKYVIVAAVGHGAANNVTKYALRITVNGSTIKSSISSFPSDQFPRLVIAEIYNLSATDYVEVQCYQVSTAAEDTDPDWTHFGMQRIG